MQSNGFWYAYVPNTTKQQRLISTADGIKTVVPEMLEFCGAEKHHVVDKLLEYFRSAK
jgi:hypothetical protein